MEKFKDADSVNSKTWSGRSREESVIFREETFTASPRKLIRRASLELCISQNSAYRTSHKCVQTASRKNVFSKGLLCMTNVLSAIQRRS